MSPLNNKLIYTRYTAVRCWYSKSTEVEHTMHWHLRVNTVESNSSITLEVNAAYQLADTRLQIWLQSQPMRQLLTGGWPMRQLLTADRSVWISMPNSDVFRKCTQKSK